MCDRCFSTGKQTHVTFKQNKKKTKVQTTVHAEKAEDSTEVTLRNKIPAWAVGNSELKIRSHILFSNHMIFY